MRSRLEDLEDAETGVLAASFTGQWYHFGRFPEAFRRVRSVRTEQVPHVVIDLNDFVTFR